MTAPSLYDRVLAHNAGRTHWDGCEADHLVCALWQRLGNATQSTAEMGALVESENNGSMLERLASALGGRSRSGTGGTWIDMPDHTWDVGDFPSGLHRRILSALDTARTRYEASEAARDGQRESVTRMCAEIARLNALDSMRCDEIQRLHRLNQSGLDDFSALRKDTDAEIAGLRGQVAEAEADKARLDWLQDNRLIIQDGQDLRRAIDHAARAAATKEKP